MVIAVLLAVWVRWLKEPVKDPDRVVLRTNDKPGGKNA
jgi:hypothetical protein